MRLLDAFCGEGGASMGYVNAGFEVFGVDNRSMPNYLFDFVQADAMEYIKEHGHEFDVIHASPPCHDHSALRSMSKSHDTGWMLEATRLLCVASGKPYVIENVPLADMPGSIILCGSMFDLQADCKDGVTRQLRRHRKFLSNLAIEPPWPCMHSGQPVGVYGIGGGIDGARGYKGNMEECCEAMDIYWMSRHGISQAIPPAYTEHIGSELVRLING